MPYALPPGADPDTTGVHLRLDSPRRFTLMTRFWYAPSEPLSPELDAMLPAPLPPDPDAVLTPPAQASDAQRHWLLIPPGGTDLGSIPGVLWGLVASYGRHTLAVLVHDHLSALADKAPATERFLRRTAADEVFYQALRDPEAGAYRSPWFRSLVLWTGVSVERYLSYNGGRFGVLAGATVGAWVAGWWLAENVGGRPFPFAAWILLLMGLALLAVAGVFATRLTRLQPRGMGLSPAHPTVAPTKLQQAVGFVPVHSETVARASDAWVVRTLAAGAALLLVAAAWTSTPVPPLFGVGIPGFLALLGALALLAGSVFLALSPVRRDAVLPLMLAIAAPTIGLIALVTIVVLYVLWIPDAFSGVTEGPINTVDDPDRVG